MLVSINEYFLLIVCCVKGKNKVCCIIIYYCELKIKMDKYCVCIKNYKRPIKVEYNRAGKMIHLHGIHCNTLISHLSYSGVYQDEV